MFGLSKLLGSRKRQRLARTTWSVPDLKKFEWPKDTVVYLIGFSYDAPTGQMFNWLCDILSSRKNDRERVVRFTDSQFSRQDLSGLLKSDQKRVELFCGHGCYTGLFGPPQGEIAGSILKELTSIIYDQDMITETPSSMFAFCCQAAHTFGRVFSAYKDKQFMGFVDDVPFPVELYDDLKYVFQAVAKDIIQAGRILPRHREIFIDKLYDVRSKAHEFMNPTLVELWLDEFEKHLKVYA